ncbi:hypothetical protein ACI781_06990 [Blastococcus sp. SYSU D00695]
MTNAVRRGTTTARRCLAVGLWLVAAAAAAVVGLDPDGLLRT